MPRRSASPRQTVVDDVQTLAAAGIGDYNIDLIAGLSGQTEASWRESLEWVERLQPPHVSVYMLEVDEDSRLGSEMLRGGARYGASETPGDDQTAAFYETAVERLAALGIARYEISNFARPGFESRHERGVRVWYEKLAHVLSVDRLTGEPCIRGMRVTAGMIVGLVASGRSNAEIRAAYPYIEDEDIRQALAYAAWRVKEIEVPLPTA